jgi:hypothetical protein
VKEFTSLEDQLGFSCRHDGRGSIICLASLGQAHPPAWKLTAEIDFGAAAHLERIAIDADEFVARR